MKDKLFAHQETISILSKQKEAQIKFYKTWEDKELDKVIELENKVKVLDNIVYKTGQTVQMMNMLNNKCRTSFAKPEFLKKLRRANPRLYDIGCYNDNLALMLAPDSDEVIRLEKESRSKVSDLIRPFDYENLNNLPQLKSNLMGDRVLHKNSRGKKQEVEDQCRNVKLSKNKTSVTTCNDSLNAKNLNVKFVSAMCDKCVLIDKHAMCVLNSVAKPIKRTVALESNKKPRNFTRKLCESVSKTCSWWYSKFTPSGYKWKHKYGKENVNLKVSMPLGNTSRTANVMDTMTSRRSTVLNTPLSSNSFATRRDCPIHLKFRNDQIAPILRYGDLVQGAVTIKRVYYVEWLNHNLFSVGQFWDADFEVAFRKSTCFIRNLKGNDLLTGSHGTDLYSITLQNTNCPNLICLMAKASSSQAWLWHRRLSHLNFDTINLMSKNDIVVGLPKLKFVKDHLCSSCELGKAKRKSFYTKLTPSSKRRGHQAQVRVVRTDKGMKFLNQTLHAYFTIEGILHQTSVARTPEQNGVVKRRNRTLVEAARTMLNATKVPLFFWAEAITTACFTQNRSLVIPRHKKTPYHIINDRKSSVKFFHIFGSICYIVRDGENLDKIKEKGDVCIFVGYSTQSRAYRVFNKRTRVNMESIHVNFDELPQMASDHISSEPAPDCQTMALNH
nr:integrase, catalytic region, zinc finger, CCHC-type, peptidase aspartic, catalytic [Tanacetum cinerariifolium]